MTAACFLIVTLVSSCVRDSDTPIPDEAKRAGRAPDTLKPANNDYFADMDRGMSRHPDQVLAALPFLKTQEVAVETFVKGRNNWIVWTAGNDTLWNYLSNHTFGALDFLKTLSTHDTLGFGRNKGEYGRWKYFGLVNEPCFEPATAPDPKRFGLWLDKRRSGPDCPPDPFEDEQKYPGVRIGARGQNLNLSADKKRLGWPDALPVGSHYGYATGVVTSSTRYPPPVRGVMFPFAFTCASSAESCSTWSIDTSVMPWWWAMNDLTITASRPGGTCPGV